jgi:hypothetical protein
MGSKIALLGLALLVCCSAMAVLCTSGSSLQILERSIKVQEFTADAAQSVATVQGVVRNAGGWPIEGCEVRVVFYDYQGTSLGTYPETRQRLEGGETWNFKVELKGSDAWKVASYTISTTCR